MAPTTDEMGHPLVLHVKYLKKSVVLKVENRFEEVADLNMRDQHLPDLFEPELKIRRHDCHLHIAVATFKLLQQSQQQHRFVQGFAGGGAALAKGSEEGEGSGEVDHLTGYMDKLLVWAFGSLIFKGMDVGFLILVLRPKVK